MGIKITGLSPKIKIEWVDEFPLCPYCTKSLDRVEATSKNVLFTSHVMYRCPYCKKLLSTGLDRAN